MDLKEHYKTLENAIAQLGVKPEDARCAEDGQWLLYRGDLELYIDVWEEEPNEWSYHPDAHNRIMFQVVCPISNITNEQKKLYFYEDLLQMNFYTQLASFVINKNDNMLTCVVKKCVQSIDVADVVECIDATGYYADLAWKMLHNPYELKKV